MKRLAIILTALSLLLLCACKPKTAVTNKHEYFPVSEKQGESYVSAVKAFNTFLNNNSKAIGKESAIEVTVDDLLATGDNAINEFILFDMNRDGSPELHFSGATYAIFTAVNDQVVLVYSEEAKLEFHQLLGLPAVMGMQRNKANVVYRFVMMQPNGDIDIVSFSDPRGYGTTAPFVFNGKVVEETEWISLTKSFFDYTKNALTLEWEAYIKYH